MVRRTDLNKDMTIIVTLNSDGLIVIDYGKIKQQFITIRNDYRNIKYR